MHYLWSNQANSLQPSLQTRNIQASHLNMRAQAVKSTGMHTKEKQSKTSGIKSLSSCTGKKKSFLYRKDGYLGHYCIKKKGDGGHSVKLLHFACSVITVITLSACTYTNWRLRWYGGCVRVSAWGECDYCVYPKPLILTECCDMED